MSGLHAAPLKLRAYDQDAHASKGLLKEQEDARQRQAMFAFTAVTALCESNVLQRLQSRDRQVAKLVATTKSLNWRLQSAALLQRVRQG